MTLDMDLLCTYAYFFEGLQIKAGTQRKYVLTGLLVIVVIYRMLWYARSRYLTGAALAELGFTPNLKADDWTNPREVTLGEKGWVAKAQLGTPMGNIATNDQYLLNPVYETEIIQDAARKRVVMNLVGHRPMRCRTCSPGGLLFGDERALFSPQGGAAGDAMDSIS